MTPEKLRKRFRVDEKTGCWIWTGSTSVHGNQPRVTVDGTNVQARRHVFEVFTGRQLKPGELAACGCGDSRCVAPLHTLPSSKQQVLQLAKHRGAYAMTEERRSKIAHTRRAQSARMSMEKAEAMRADPRTIYEVAAEVGVHPTLVAKVRRGECWSPS